MAIRRPLILNAGKVGEIPNGDTFPADVIPSAPRVALPDQVQSAHGFVAGDVIRYSGGTWVKAIASTRATALAIAVVESITTNTFLPVLAGRIVLSGLTAGAEYYLSDVTAGLLTTTSPAVGSTSYQVPILRAVSTTTAYVEIAAPMPMGLIPPSSLGGLETNAAATLSNTNFFSTLALSTFLSAWFDGTSFPHARITGLAAGEIPIGGTDLGASAVATLGAGLSYNPVTGVISATATGTTAAVEITGTNIDGAVGTLRKKVLNGAVNFTASNMADGLRVIILLSAIGADRTPTWPDNFDWGSAGAPTILNGESVQVTLTVWGSQIAAYSEATGLTIDVSPPTLVSATINAAGHLVLVWNEAVSAGADAIAGLALAMSGGATPLTLASGDGTTTWTLTTDRVIVGSETGTISYTKSDDGLADDVGNLLASFTGVTVENDSEASAYLFSYDFQGSWPPSGIVGATGLQLTCAPDLSDGTGNQCLRINSSAHAPYREFAPDNVFWAETDFRSAAQGVPLRIRNGGTNLAFIQFLLNGSQYDARLYTAGNYSTRANVTNYAPNTPLKIIIRYCAADPANVSNPGAATVAFWLVAQGAPFPGGAPTGRREHTVALGQANRLYWNPDSTIEFRYDNTKGSHSTPV